MIICSAVKPARCECWGWREWGNVTHDRREFVRHDERVFMLLWDHLEQMHGVAIAVLTSASVAAATSIFIASAAVRIWVMRMVFA